MHIVRCYSYLIVVKRTYKWLPRNSAVSSCPHPPFGFEQFAISNLALLIVRRGRRDYSNSPASQKSIMNFSRNKMRIIIAFLVVLCALLQVNLCRSSALFHSLYIASNYGFFRYRPTQRNQRLSQPVSLHHSQLIDRRRNHPANRHQSHLYSPQQGRPVSQVRSPLLGLVRSLRANQHRSPLVNQF